MVKIGNIRDAGGLVGTHILNSAHAIDTSSNNLPAGTDDYGGGLVVLGNVYGESGDPEDDTDPEVERGTIPGVDWSEYLGYRSRRGLDGFVTMPMSMLGQRPRYGSLAMIRRMRGSTRSFLSSPGGGGSVGAMFVDTDGFTVQDGDDF